MTKVIVHPQMMLQLADHSTRAQFFDKNHQFEFIIGVLYGIIDAKKIELCSTFESITVREGGKLKIEESSFEALANHHSKNFVGEELIGWYSLRPITEAQIAELDAAFSAKFNPIIRGQYKHDANHPLTLYKINEDKKWHQINYKYESEIAEHVALVQLQSQGDAKLQVSFQAEAYKSCDRQLEIIENYLDNVANGKVKFNGNLVRRCADVGLWFHSRAESKGNDEEVDIAEGELALLCGMVSEALLAVNATVKPRTQPQGRTAPHFIQL